MPRTSRLVAVAVALAAILLGWGASVDRQDTLPPAPADTTAAPTPDPGGAAATEGIATDALAGLAVKGRAPKTGYSREQFGQSWRDVDRNGCDQRNDALRRDLTEVTVKPGTHGCVVDAGILVSPYSGATVPFTRGRTSSAEVPIDHVVALSDAWQKGAQQWTPAKRETFANDLLELWATDRWTNSSKGDSDAASWLPPLKAVRCEYVARQIAVKAAYGLWVTRAEHDAIGRVLDRCPAQRIPS
jgi:hypothetical protein